MNEKEKDALLKAVSKYCEPDDGKLEFKNEWMKMDYICQCLNLIVKDAKIPIKQIQREILMQSNIIIPISKIESLLYRKLQLV